MTQNEATIPLPARGDRQLFDRSSKVVDLLAGRDADKGEVSAVERFVACGPANRTCERSRTLGITPRQEEDAPQSPVMKAPTRRRTASGRDAQVRDGGGDIARSESCASGVLMNHVGENSKTEGLDSGRVSALEAAFFVVR